MLRAVLLACALAAPAVAQTGLTLTAGATRLGYDADRVGRFDETYSAFYAQRLDGETELVPSEVTGYAVGAALSFGVGPASLRVGYEYGWASTDARSRFENGAGDRVRTDARDHVATMALLVPLVSRLQVGPVVSATFREMTVTSRSIYSDGSESLGGEYLLNGVYEGSPTYVEAGGVLRLGLLRRLAVPVRVTVPLGSPGGDLDIPLTDYDLLQGNDVFPRDWDRWRVDQIGSDEAAALQGDDFKGMRVHVGLEISL